MPALKHEKNPSWYMRNHGCRHTGNLPAKAPHQPRFKDLQHRYTRGPALQCWLISTNQRCAAYPRRHSTEPPYTLLPRRHSNQLGAELSDHIGGPITITRPRTWIVDEHHVRESVPILQWPNYRDRTTIMLTHLHQPSHAPVDTKKLPDMYAHVR